MTEATLLALIAELRGRDQGPLPQTEPFPHPGELTFSRARELAHNPSGSTQLEQAHLAECRRCAQMVQSARDELPKHHKASEEGLPNEVAGQVPGPAVPVDERAWQGGDEVRA